MSTCKVKVEHNSEYMDNYYPTVDQFLNEGGLTLVSKPFMKWAKVLFIAMNLNLNEGKIWRKKPNVIKDAVKIISNNPSLQKKI